MATTASNYSYELTVASGSVFLFTIFGKFGSLYWIFDLFSHFTIQFLLVGFALLGSILVLDRKNLTAIFFVSAAIGINVANVLPLFRKTVDPTSSGIKIKIASINLNRSNDDWSSLEKYLESYQPDIVAFFELTPVWDAKLKTLQSTFPYGNALPLTDNFGIGIISKLPLTNTKIWKVTAYELPLITTDVELQNHHIKFVGAHSFPPIGPTGTRIRNDYLDWIATFLQSQTGPQVLCGDLNITHWSPQFKEFLKSSKLTVPNDLVNTWPTFIPFLRIPIDHCATSSQIHVNSYSRGPNIGSDHYPIEATITLINDP